MKRIYWIVAISLAAASIVAAQQSPASRQPPPTVKPQSYPPELVRTGQTRFSSECGFCHGRDAAGGETGPDLTRSRLVAEDSRGDKIGRVVRAGRLDKGMPSFDFNDADLGAIVAFIHDQKTKAESVGGGRRAVDVADLATGDAEKGRAYFNGAGNCSQCHSATNDFAGIGTRLQGLPLLQRMLYPSGSRRLAKVTVTLPSGEMVSGSLVSRDEFSIVVTDSTGVNRTFATNEVKFTVDDPMNAHFEQLGKYTDDDMHNVYAYLQTLR